MFCLAEDSNNEYRCVFFIFCRSHIAENILEHSVEIKNKEMRTSVKSLLEPVCALLNSGGGILKIKITDYWDVKPSPPKQWDTFWSALEQKLVPMIQPSEYGDIFDRKDNDDEVWLFIKAPDHLCTVDFNLYSALDAKNSQATYKKVQELLSEGHVGGGRNYKDPDPQFPLENLLVDLQPEDFKFKNIPHFHESKNVQFKYYTSSNGIFHNNNGTQIDDFRKQISAFGNGSGGMILLGVKDNGEVFGQVMDEHDKAILQERVETIIDNMRCSWMFTPKRGIHWNMQFFPVEDTESSFVIVILIAGMQNLGGIFTKCPESYKLKSPERGRKLETQPIDVLEWRKRMLCRTEGDSKGWFMYITLHLRQPRFKAHSHSDKMIMYYLVQ